MIIQCEQCNTKFRLDDSKVTDKGAKVRCAKCRHVFTVYKEQPQSEPEPGFGALLDRQTAAPEQPAASAPPAPEASDTSSFDTSSFDSTSFDASTFESSSFGQDSLTDSADTPSASPFESPASPAPAAGDGEFSLSSLEGEAGFALDKDEQPAGEVDFGSFDFGDAADAADKTMLAPAPAPDLGEMTMMQPPPAPAEPAAPAKSPEDEISFDFGEESLFGDAVAAPVVEEPSTTIKFDLQMDEFADSMGVEATPGDLRFAEPKIDEPFSLGEIDFGDELSSVAVQQVNPEELKPGQDLLFAPLAGAAEKPAPAAPAAPVQPAAQPAPEEELPPLSIPSRRKQSPLLMVLVGLLGVVAVGAIAFFSLPLLNSGKGKGAAPEAGRISVRGVDAAFVKNKEAGELLVISGEAVNEFKEPRAALQVKGLIFGADGQVLTSKNAYAGNPLTKEQLSTMPLDKIDGAMANQFGDSLSNLEVPPGKGVPFTIVLARPAAEAKDYGVEPAGSTVATGKQ